MAVYILGIESSCDDTSAAVIRDDVVLSNVIANQSVHAEYGGVVPEYASRVHQQNIVPVVDTALKKAGVSKDELSAIAYTRGPGLLGSLLVGSSFAKSMALALNIPLLDVNHMYAHIMAHFIRNEARTNPVPEFPFLCLTVSGGHTQITVVKSPSDLEIIGQTIDDAAGEAFDKIAKIMSLPYPGGPVIDRLAAQGDPAAFAFSKPVVPGYDYSFSGLKTSVLYFLRDRLKEDTDFIETNKTHISASVQAAIIDILLQKVIKAVNDTGINRVAIAGGVSANSGLRSAMLEMQGKAGWEVFIPEFQYTTDNAAMVAIAGYFKFREGDFASQVLAPYSRA